MINEEGYKLGGSMVYSIYYSDNNEWLLFDTITENDNIDKIKHYADIVSKNKNTETVVIENNAPNSIPKKLDNLDNQTVIYKNEIQKEMYDEAWLNRFSSSDDKSDMNYTVQETKEALEKLFMVEPTKNITEDKFNDNFINVTMLIQRNPLIESSTLLLDYAEQKFGDENIAEELAEIIENKTGMDLYEFTKLMREKGTAHYSKSAHDWVDKQVEKLYPAHIKDKEEAFGVAWNQYSKKNSK